MKIVLFCTAFNGLSQRAWIELRAMDHDVIVHLASDANPIERVCNRTDPDLVICPFLKDRVPESVWRRYRTIIIHPGPIGDRGASSLDWAIANGERQWGVTALQAVDEMDAGPIWASRTFAVATEPVRKGELYNGPVADAAIELISEVVAKAGDPSFVPVPLDYGRPGVTGRMRPTMTQADRKFSWHDSTSVILRSIRAADGAPGVRTKLGAREISVFDAHPGSASGGRPGWPGRSGSAARPGSIVGVRNGAVLVTTGDGTIWIGQARPVGVAGGTAIKLPAAVVLRDELDGAFALMPNPSEALGGGNDVTYRRVGDVGIVAFDFYNGAMSTSRCRRLATVLDHAAGQDTKVVVLRGGEVFSNGIDLNTIEAANNPAMESWTNIGAIDDVCRTIITSTDQLIIASVGANAGAGGVMLALGADRVIVRSSVVLNPHYASMGLYGSEYWTYVLPRRIGRAEAQRLTGACLPIGAEGAVRIGLADRLIAGGRDEFEEAVLAEARTLAGGRRLGEMVRAKQSRRHRDEARKPLEAYRHEELGEMSRDMFDNRSGFNEARKTFVHKRKASGTPAHLAAAA